MKDDHVLLTGATGFIGGHLAFRLMERGARLTILNRPGRTPVDLKARRIEADLADADGLMRALAPLSPDLVLHLAAVTDVRREPGLASRCRAVNYEGTMNLVRAVASKGIRRMVHLGTCEEYGVGDAPFREEAQSRPVSPYSESKARATQYLIDRYGTERFPVVVLRPFLTYGLGQSRHRFLAQAVEAALADRPFEMTPGLQTREFNHVDDIVEGILLAAEAAGIEGEIINLCCGEEHRLIDVAKRVYDLARSTAGPVAGALPYREGEAMRFFGSTEKCRRLLRYRPRVSFEQGLAGLIERMEGGNHA